MFEDSPIGLDKWFTAMWLIAGAKNGISSTKFTAPSASRKKPHGSCSTAFALRCRPRRSTGFNNRDDNDAGRRVTYKVLTGGQTA